LYGLGPAQHRYRLAGVVVHIATYVQHAGGAALGTSTGIRRRRLTRSFRAVARFTDPTTPGAL